ncbi:hypothetical protein HDU67_002012 [Dinochytrium kinnereticum]|nr:hypothetical protein HDU67_002012 [Dinochytrium kinnereticum]
MNRLLWNVTDARAPSFAIENWFSLPIKSVWFVFPQSGLTEGTLSLLFTLISGTILGLFFYGFRYIWSPKYDTNQESEETAWLSFTNGVGSGNAVYATFYGSVAASRAHLKTPKFLASLIGPVVLWALVSLLSGAAQISIHSVRAMQKTSVVLEVQSLNFTALVRAGLYQVLGMGDQKGAPLLQGAGFKIIKGQNRNLTAMSFLLDGRVCSGQLFPHSTYDVECLVDKTTCQSASYRWNTIDPKFPIIDYLPFDDPLYDSRAVKFSKLDLLPFTNLVIVDSELAWKTNRVDEAGNIFGRINLTNFKLTYDYTGSIPLSNITTWKDQGGGTIVPKPDPTVTHKSPFRMFRGASSMDFWRGRCYQRVDLCRVQVSDGHVTDEKGCTPSPIHIPIWAGFTPESIIAIGEIWRTDSTFPNMMSRSQFRHEVFDAEVLMARSLGTMGLAWAATMFQLDFVLGSPDSTISASPIEMDRFVKTEKITVSMVDPRDAIAFDAILVLILITFFVVSSVLFLLGVTSAILGKDEASQRRMMEWDPLYRYAVLMNSEEFLIKTSALAPLEALGKEKAIEKA